MMSVTKLIFSFDFLSGFAFANRAVVAAQRERRTADAASCEEIISPFDNAYGYVTFI